RGRNGGKQMTITTRGRRRFARTKWPRRGGSAIRSAAAPRLRSGPRSHRARTRRRAWFLRYTVVTIPPAGSLAGQRRRLRAALAIYEAAGVISNDSDLAEPI